uniref:ribosomal protein S17 n=1 Tax=Porphyridium aerugineum TaxID=2792 RepID=UPI001FCCF693|nr:ribosomal protein S17 [Porphyridium aerugineum]UNJ17882.1 ribosomal protein S17 [Porphyridium aerugineum]
MPAKQIIGTVVSDKMNKTRVIAVENKIAHPKYGKTIVKTKKYKAHDENNQSNDGDIVRIEATRPLSKTKRWVVMDILTKVSKSSLLE